MDRASFPQRYGRINRIPAEASSKPEGRDGYYVLRLSDPLKNPHSVQPSQTARALKVVLKIRHGVPIRLAISLKHA
jgi:hypothetical protein